FHSLHIGPSIRNQINPQSALDVGKRLSIAGAASDFTIVLNPKGDDSAIRRGIRPHGNVNRQRLSMGTSRLALDAVVFPQLLEKIAACVLKDFVDAPQL